MYRGTFEQARTKAKESRKWLMVNLQDSSEFVCQTLNRDLWKDAMVQEIVTESFIFFQVNAESTDGKRYVNYYPVSGYPHVSIIDPRTGERVVTLRDVNVPSDFVMEGKFRHLKPVVSNEYAVPETRSSDGIP